MSKKKTIKEAQDFFKTKGLTLLATEYKNALMPMLTRCDECQYEWKICYNNVQQGCGCPKCSRKLKHTLLDFQKLAKFCGYECLADYYTNALTPELCRCLECNHRWKIHYNNLLQGRNCPKCAGLLIKTLSDFQELARSKGYKCLATSYTNANIPELCRCNKCKYEWKISYHNLQQDRGCPKCAKRQSKRELYLYEIVKFSYPDAISGKRGVLKNKRFQLDIYIPSLKKAVEFDGDYWHKSKLAIKNKSINRDLRKNIECKNANIKLLRISDTEFNSDKEKTIIKIMDFLENSFIVGKL